MSAGGYWTRALEERIADMRAAHVLNCEMESGCLLTLASLFRARAGCVCVVSDRPPPPRPPARPGGLAPPPPAPPPLPRAARLRRGGVGPPPRARSPAPRPGPGRGVRSD